MEERIGIDEIKTIPLLDDRQQKECLLAITYEKEFQHGTDGHNRLLLIARLVRLLVTLVRQNRMSDEAIHGWRRLNREQKELIEELRAPRYRLEGERE